MRYLLFTLCLLLSQQAFAQNTDQNRVKGKVSFPALKKRIKKGNDYNKDGTAMMHSDDPMAQMNRNVIVSLLPLSFKAEVKPLSNARITQKEQTFLPHVLAVTKGTTIYFLNEDEFFHNIYSLSPGARFNIGRRPPGNPYPIKIKKLGVIKLSCDIHPHMNGFILSLNTPYFTRVNADGTYDLSGLPNGKYLLKVFHPQLPIQEFSIDLDKGQTLTFDIDLSDSEPR